MSKGNTIMNNKYKYMVNLRVYGSQHNKQETTAQICRRANNISN